MSSPTSLLTIFAIYLLAVYVVLPKFMQSRNAFNLTSVIRIYNVLQVILCCFTLYIMRVYGMRYSKTWKCYSAHYDDSHNIVGLEQAHWYFIILRAAEFLETVFFLLRKKSNQVSLLHVYHHISTVALLYIFLKYNGGVMGVYLGFINSSVHVVMYSYYFFSSMESFKKLTNLIKPFITAMQITQLVVLNGQCISALRSSCDTPNWMYILQLINVTILIFMFVKFYMQSYYKRKNL